MSFGPLTAITCAVWAYVAQVQDSKAYLIEKALRGGTFDDIPTTVLYPFDRLKVVARGIANHSAEMVP